MNYQLLITLLFYFFPEKLCWHFERFMDIKTVSFSGSNIVEKLLCNNNTLKPSENSIDQDSKIIVCFKYRDYSVLSPTIICKNSSLSITKENCIGNLINEFNKIFQRLSSIKLSSKTVTKISISLRIMNKQGLNSKSEFITIKEVTAGPVKNLITVTMSGDAIFNVTLVYSFHCDKYYYGPNCQNFCKPMDKVSGHYNCTETGQRICLDGWKGIFCSEANCDQCMNGQCVGPGKCSCYRGWTGKNCEICLKAPGCMQGMCQNDTGLFNSSKPQVKVFTCSCYPGWGGQHCDIDLKHCIKHAGLCKNSGICHNYYGDHIKHYLCQCAPGYYGRHCEIQTGDCNHDKFSPKNYLTPTCRCYPGFSGSYCQINNALQFQINSIKNFLKSNGYCVNSNEGYSCSCSDLYGGLCKCRFVKCLNQGQCIDSYSPDIKCSNIENAISMFEFSSNFKFENSSLVLQFDSTVDSNQETTHAFYVKYYFSSIIFVPLLFGILILLAIKFRHKFRRKSRTTIKTIHNDLGFVNNLIKNPVAFTEQSFLLNQKAMPISFSNGNCINNLFSVTEMIENPNKFSDGVLSKKSDEENTKTDLSNPIIENSVIQPVKDPMTCNPNLLVNNYKNIDENKK